MVIPCWNYHTRNKMDKYLIMSPHPDDSAFAIGGTMLINEDTFINCDVFSDKEYVVKKINGSDFKKLISDEEKLAMEMFQIKNINLNFKDAYSRNIGKLSEIFGKKKELDSIKQLVIYEEVKCRINVLIDKINPKGVFFPLSCGWHIDHMIVHHCILELLNSYSDMEAYMYEDMPYSCNEEWRTKVIKEKLCDFELQETIVDISEVISKKEQIIRVYKSQLRERDIIWMKRYMNSIREGQVCERFWKIMRKK